MSLIISILIAAALLSTLLWLMVRYRRAQEEMWRIFAAEEELEFLGNSLPEGLPWTVPGKLGVRFCVSGVRYGARVICYQFRTMEKNRWWAGVVGCQTPSDIAPNANLEQFDRMDRSGGWVLYWNSMWTRAWTTRTVDPDDVRAVWDALRTYDRNATCDGGVLIRPRHEAI